MVKKTQAEIEADYLPRIAAAKSCADERRDEAWLAVPYSICGLPVRAMTLADYLALIASGNAHVTTQPEPADPAAFWALHDGILLWRLSPDYAPDPAARQRFIKRVRALDLPAVHEGISAYLVEIFADRCKPVVVEGTAIVPLSIAASFAACWIHDFATEYGWTDEHTLSRPLPRIFQLRQLLSLEATLKAGKRPAPCSDEADRLAAQCFAEIAALAD